MRSDHLEPLTVVREDLTPPNGRQFFTDPQLPSAGPVFSTREVSKTFFGRGKLWMQRLMEQDTGIEIPRSEAGYRRFQLHHVELLSHVFLRHGIIDVNTFANCTLIIRAIARNYRL